MIPPHTYRMLLNEVIDVVPFPGIIVQAYYASSDQSVIAFQRTVQSPDLIPETDRIHSRCGNIENTAGVSECAMVYNLLSSHAR